MDSGESFGYWDKSALPIRPRTDAAHHPPKRLLSLFNLQHVAPPKRIPLTNRFNYVLCASARGARVHRVCDHDPLV